MITSVCQDIPVGKFRVIGHELFEHSYYVVKDCDTEVEAFKLADDFNREYTPEFYIYTVYEVYDDKNNRLRGAEAVGNAEDKTAVGVSP